ncbi:hypothetical protein JCM10207_003961 [Rhodosporidiobolus poonsookiae]
MSTTPPLATARSRSASLSSTLPPPLPLSSPAPLISPPLPSSTLSASLKAFQDLSLSPDTHSGSLDTEAFREAFHHARKASFGNQGTTVRPIIIPDSAATTAQELPTPGLSTSPSSEATSGSLPTPSSSPTSSSAFSPPPLATTTTKARSVSNGKVGKPSATLGGVCEQDELALERGELRLPDDDLATPPAQAHSHAHSRAASGSLISNGSGTGSNSVFAGGARWGWPGSASPSSSNNFTGPLSPPAEPSSLQRRGSLAFASPPSAIRAPGTASPTSTGAGAGVTSPTSPPGGGDPFKMMQPLGRVVSAGAALQTPHKGGSSSGGGAGGGGGGGKEGFSIFRRFSISGLGKTRPSVPPPSAPVPAPAPAPSHTPVPTIAPPVLSPSSVEAPASAPPQSGAGLQRGRSLGVGSGGAKAKRRISPMGEKILRGGY